MPLWGNSNIKAKAPKFKVIERKANGGGIAGHAARGTNTAFNNTSVGAWGNTLISKGIFGANSTDVHASSRKDITHTGWHEVRQGTGPVVSFTISAGGTGYSNTDTVKVAVVAPGVNAAATLTTNATGGITAVTLTAGGSGFANVSSATVSFANSTGGVSAGSGATIVPKFGGRAGRKHYECLVAGSMTGTPPATLP